MVQALKKAVSQKPVVLVMAKAKFVFNKVFSRYNKLVHIVMARVVRFLIHAMIVMAKAVLSKRKLSKLKFQKGLIQAIEFV